MPGVGGGAQPVCASLIGGLSHHCSSLNSLSRLDPAPTMLLIIPLTCKCLERDFSVASLPDAEIYVYLLVLHRMPQGKTEETGCVSGPPRAGSMVGHRSPESRPDTGRRGEPYWPRVASALLEVPDQNPEVKGHAFRMLIKLNWMKWKESGFWSLKAGLGLGLAPDAMILDILLSSMFL